MSKAEIPRLIADAVISMLHPFAPELTFEKLQTMAFIESTKCEKPEKLLTRKETAEALHISIPTVDRMLRDGELSLRHIRGAVKIPLSEIEAVMQGRHPE